MYYKSRASPVAQQVKNPPAMQEAQIQSLGGKIPWSRKWQPTPVFWPAKFQGLDSPWYNRVGQDCATFTLITLSF